MVAQNKKINSPELGKVLRQVMKKVSSTVPSAVNKTPKKSISKASPQALKKSTAPNSLDKKVPKVTAAPPKLVNKPRQVIKKASIKVPAVVNTLPKKSLSKIASPALKENETYMNDSQKAHFKQRLQAWRVVLMNKIESVALQIKDPLHFADSNDRATREEAFNLELQARDRDATLVIKIDAALKKIHEGEYGYCEECGIPIGFSRLEARLTAVMCVECQTSEEIRKRQWRHVLHG